MKLLSLLITAAGFGVLIGYYLETDNPVLTTGLVITITGIFIGLMATNKASK